MKIKIDELECTSATQIRVKLHKDVIDQYREDLESGALFPPIICFAEKGSKRIIVSDGHHRVYAHVHAGIEKIDVDKRRGNMHDALLFALGANQRHGIQRSNADKIHAVRMALKDPEIAEHTQQEIADIIGVTRETVNRISRRKTLDDNEADTEPGKPEKNKDSNTRPTKVPPTQSQIEREEVRAAMGLIKALPYDGQETSKLRFTKADIADLEYVSTWAAHAVIAYRKKK